MSINTTDQLANERTFLAYLRTSIAFIGFGFVVARFGVFLRQAALIEHATVVRTGLDSTTFGILMVVVGLAVAVFGLSRYVAVMRALAAGEPTALSIRAATGIVVCLAIFSVIVVSLLSGAARL